MSQFSWTDRFAGLSKLSAPIRQKLETAAKIRDISEGTRIFGPGDTPAGMLFLMEGTIRVHQLSESGRDIVLYRITAGESCIMTTACLFTHHSYMTEGVAETDVTAAEVPRRVFENLVSESPEFRDFILSAYSHRIVDLFQVIDHVVFGRMDLRMAERLVKIADESGVARITHQEMADELGTAREVVSRLLNEFRKNGWITSGRGQIKLLDQKALKDLAAKD